MQYLTSFFFLILVITSSSPHPQRVDVNVEKEIDIVAAFQMNVFNNGLASDDTLFVSLKIYSDQGEIRAKWKHAYYKLFDETGVGVRIQQFSTSNDTITGLEVNDKNFEFTLHYDLKSPLKVVGTRIGKSYHVEGVGLWWNENDEKAVKVKWCSVDQLHIPPADPKADI